MSKRGDKAYELFMSGYNCSQAVAGAFSDVLGMDFETVVKLGSGFGGGMGRMREVCGTFSGIVMVVSMLYGYSDPKDNSTKTGLYGRIQEIAEQFRRDNGSIICKELLGLSKPEGSPVPEQRTSEYYKKRPCPELCRYAADILEKYIAEHPVK
ncbi:MAG: C_GCAxxG_C_C family protein [Oscillospiraceae bacterium]|nr:C_GCAxxG_C_C family protein [Oscillospiraceae bacterium]